MSSSPSPALAPKELEEPSECRPFPYDSVPRAANGIAVPEWSAQEELSSPAGREEQARVQGRQEGLAQAQKALEERVARERTNLAGALEGFARDRAVYFQRVEAEVVQLALAIARKILHREAQIDPMLLAGMVRVALEKIDGATEVELRVHPSHAAEWKQFLSAHFDAEALPKIVEDSALEPDRCILQTSMGRCLVGVDAQFKEIEQGLLDLLAARPGVGP